jgi:hypothetical protein
MQWQIRNDMLAMDDDLELHGKKQMWSISLRKIMQPMKYFSQNIMFCDQDSNWRPTKYESEV